MCTPLVVAWFRLVSFDRIGSIRCAVSLCACVCACVSEAAFGGRESERYRKGCRLPPPSIAPSCWIRSLCQKCQLRIALLHNSTVPRAHQPRSIQRTSERQTRRERQPPSAPFPVTPPPALFVLPSSARAAPFPRHTAPRPPSFDPLRRPRSSWGRHERGGGAFPPSLPRRREENNPFASDGRRRIDRPAPFRLRPRSTRDPHAPGRVWAQSG